MRFGGPGHSGAARLGAALACRKAPQALYKPIRDINPQILKRLLHDYLDFFQLAARSDLTRSRQNQFALRIDDPEVPPSAVSQASSPFSHRFVQS